MSAVMRCEPCGKNFTGPVCYNQHLESEKHKKKILSVSLLNNSSGANAQVASTGVQLTQLSLFECSVCKVAFNSLRNFQTHSVSPEHAQKVIENNSENLSSSNAVSSSSGSLNFESSKDDKNTLDENDMILPVNEMCKSQTLSFSVCNICNKNFSGPEPYKQHMESAAHRKKVELEKNASSSNTIPILSQFSCDPCKKVFSGQVPYVQHMNSEIHRKKMLNLQLLEKGMTEVDSVLGYKETKADENNLQEKDQNIPWFCHICKKPCSGYIPYQQHLEGITHLKNVAKAEREKNNNLSQEDSVKIAVQISSEGKNILKSPYFINGAIEQSIEGNIKMDLDSVLPGLTDNLKVMSSEELEESVKIFLPDDNINFDKYDAEINADSGGEQIHDGSEDIQVEANGNMYHLCNLCNVNLLSKEEAISHYESLEHHSRKWKLV